MCFLPLQYTNTMLYTWLVVLASNLDISEGGWCVIPSRPPPPEDISRGVRRAGVWIVVTLVTSRLQLRQVRELRPNK